MPFFGYKNFIKKVLFFYIFLLVFHQKALIFLFFLKTQEIFLLLFCSSIATLPSLFTSQSPYKGSQASANLLQQKQLLTCSPLRQTKYFYRSKLVLLTSAQRACLSLQGKVAVSVSELTERSYFASIPNICNMSH